MAAAGQASGSGVGGEGSGVTGRRSAGETSGVETNTARPRWPGCAVNLSSVIAQAAGAVSASGSGMGFSDSFCVPAGDGATLFAGAKPQSPLGQLTSHVGQVGSGQTVTGTILQTSYET